MIKTYKQAEKVWRELISGVVFKERLDVYESFIEYTKTKRYLDIERHEIGEFDDDAIKIVEDIKAEKTMTKDSWGIDIEIYSIEELKNSDEDYFLVREPNKLFKIVKNRTVEDILKSTTENYYGKDKARISEDTVMFVPECARDYNFTIMSNNQFIPVNKIYGTVVFVGSNEFGEVYSICPSEIIKIIQNMKFFLGEGMLDLRE